MCFPWRRVFTLNFHQAGKSQNHFNSCSLFPDRWLFKWHHHSWESPTENQLPNCPIIRSDLSCHLIISNPSSPAILQRILCPLKKELYFWTVISCVIISSCTGKNWKRNSSGINHKNERSLFESADSTHQSSTCHRDSLLVHCLDPSHSSPISFTQLAVTAG